MSTSLTELSPDVEVPRPITEKLSKVVRRHQSQANIFRFGGWFALVNFALLSLIGSDLYFEFDSVSSRIVGWLMAIAGVGSFRLVWQRFTEHPLNWLEAAWRVESINPQLDERISSTIELIGEKNRNPELSFAGCSNQLLSALSQEATRASAIIDPKQLPLRSNWPVVGVAASFVSLLLCLTIINPIGVGCSVRNWLMPWAEPIFPQLTIDLLPGDTMVVQGDSLTVTAPKLGSKIDAKLEFVNPGGISATPFNCSNVRSATLMDLQQDSTYRLRIGKRVSRSYEVNVLEQPRILNQEVQIRFPDYTTLPIEASTLTAEPVMALQGATVSVHLHVDQHARHAELSWEEGQGPTQTSNDFRFEIHCDDVGTRTAKLRVFSSEGVSSEPLQITIEVSADQPPSIQILDPTISRFYLPRDRELPIQFAVQDDFGIQNAAVIYEPLGGDPSQRRSLSATLEKLPNDAAASYQGQVFVSFQELPENCVAAKVWLRAIDNRIESCGGPQAAESDALVIEFQPVEATPLEQRLAAEQQNIRQALEETRQTLEQAKTLTEELSETRQANEKTSNENDLEANSSEQQELGEREVDLQAENQPAIAQQSAEQQPNERPSGQQGVVEKNDRQQQENESREAPSARPQSQNPWEAAREKIAAGQKTLEKLAEKIEQSNSDLSQQSQMVRKMAEEPMSAAQRQLARGERMDEARNEKEAQESARKAQDHVNETLEQLQELEQALTEKTRQLETAAKLEDLARRQEKLTNELPALTEVDRNDPERDEQDSQGAESGNANSERKSTDEDWRKRQQQVAEELGAIQKHEQPQTDPAAQNAEANSEQQGLLEQADKADRLAKRTRDLAEQLENPKSGQPQEQATEEAAKPEMRSEITELQQEVEQMLQQQRERQQGRKRQDLAEQKQLAGLEEAKQHLEQVKQKLGDQPLQEQQRAPQEPNSQQGSLQRSQQSKTPTEQLRQAADSLQEHSQNCRECANCENPRGTGGNPSDPSQSQRLADAKQECEGAAQAPLEGQAKRHAKQASQKLSELAQLAAQQSGLRKNCEKCRNPGDGDSEASGNSGSNPVGTKSVTDDPFERLPIRGETTSGWTRAKRQLRKSVLDGREALIPESFRDVVTEYFEALAKEVNE